LEISLGQNFRYFKIIEKLNILNSLANKFDLFFFLVNFKTFPTAYLYPLFSAASEKV